MGEEATVIVVDVRRPDGEATDLRLEDGRVQETRVGGELRERADVAGDGLLVLPQLAEPHCHLDRILSAESAPAAGDLEDAVAWWRRQRQALDVEAVAARARSGLERFEGFGVRHLRTHVDASAAAHGVAIEGVRAACTDLDHLDVQLVAFAGLPLTGRSGAENRAALRDALEGGAHLVGGAPYRDPEPTNALETVLSLAGEAGVGVDVHVDEVTDPRTSSLETLVDLVEGDGRPYGGVTASHAVSLAFRDSADQRRLAERLAHAKVAIVTLPATNLYLQGRQALGGVGRAPRALTALSALRAAGVVVAAGADNVEDPFCPVNRGDPRETARLLVFAGHRDPSEALDMVSGSALEVLGLPRPAPESGGGDALMLVDAATIRAFVAGQGQVVRHLDGT